jgi:hypothetical protein
LHRKNSTIQKALILYNITYSQIFVESVASNSHYKNRFF